MATKPLSVGLPGEREKKRSASSSTQTLSQSMTFLTYSSSLTSFTNLRRLPINTHLVGALRGRTGARSQSPIMVTLLQISPGEREATSVAPLKCWQRLQEYCKILQILMRNPASFRLSRVLKYQNNLHVEGVRQLKYHLSTVFWMNFKSLSHKERGPVNYNSSPWVHSHDLF